MASMEDLRAIEALHVELAERNLVTRLPRRPGMKEQRDAHLFSGEPVISEEEASASPEQARLQVMSENERLSALEAEVRLPREDVASLRKVIEEFKSQFE